MSSSRISTTCIISNYLARLDSGVACDDTTSSGFAATISDEGLLVRVASGDREALAAFIERHARAVYSCIRHRVRSRETADDLFQETWIRVIERCDTYRAGSAVLPWIYRIAINVVNDDCRRSSAIRRGGSAIQVPITEAENTAVSPAAGADDVLLQNEQKAALHQAVMALPEPFGEIVRLRYFEELSVAETAMVVGCSEGTVKSRLSRGLTMLQKQLEERA